MDQKLETFLTLCKTMHYGRAAELLHLSQPAVSKHIQALEAQYGVRLFTYQAAAEDTGRRPSRAVCFFSALQRRNASRASSRKIKDSAPHRRDKIHRRLYSAAGNPPLSCKTGPAASLSCRQHGPSSRKTGRRRTRFCCPGRAF